MLMCHAKLPIDCHIILASPRWCGDEATADGMAQRVQDSYDVEKEERWRVIDGVNYIDPKLAAEQLYLKAADLPSVNPHVPMNGRREQIEADNENVVGTAVCQQLVEVLAEAERNGVGGVVVLSTELEHTYNGRKILSNSGNMSMVAFTKEAAERLLPLYESEIRPALENPFAKVITLV